jgi:hypothetical protein
MAGIAPWARAENGRNEATIDQPPMRFTNSISVSLLPGSRPADLEKRKEKKRLKLLHYRQLSSQLSFEMGEDDAGYIYDKHIMPGADFFKYLALPSVRSGHALSSRTKADRQKLNMWVPDTIIYDGVNEPVWIYSSKVRRPISTPPPPPPSLSLYTPCLPPYPPLTHPRWILPRRV